MGDGERQQGGPREGRRTGIGLGSFLPFPLNNTEHSPRTIFSLQKNDYLSHLSLSPAVCVCVCVCVVTNNYIYDYCISCYWNHLVLSSVLCPSTGSTMLANYALSGEFQVWCNATYSMGAQCRQQSARQVKGLFPAWQIKRGLNCRTLWPVATWMNISAQKSAKPALCPSHGQASWWDLVEKRQHFTPGVNALGLLRLFSGR